MPATRLVALALLALVCALPAAVAQESETVIEPHQLGRDADYDALMRFKRVQAELVYIDQLQGEIPMDGLALRPKPDDDTDTILEITPTEVSGQLVVLMLIGLLIFLIWRNRAFLLALLSRAPPSSTQAPDGEEVLEPFASPTDSSLIARLRRMADREAAIVLLLKATMERAADANGIRVSRSETASDFLRRLPGSWVHHSALRRLVMAEELVQFGGRSLSDDTFEQCLHDAAPILKPEGAPA